MNLKLESLPEYTVTGSFQVRAIGIFGILSLSLRLSVTESRREEPAAAPAVAESAPSPARKAGLFVHWNTQDIYLSVLSV